MRKNLWEDGKVLIVDDSKTSRILLRQLLKPLPVEILEASTISQFHQAIDAHNFQLILLDYRLPDGSGIEVLKEARQRGLQSTVVIITGQAEVFTATQALGQGADGYVEKQHLKQGPEAFCLTLESALLHRQSLMAKAELESLKREIYSLVAHDLRSPAACASMALKLYAEKPSEEVLQTAQSSIDRFFHRLDRYQDMLRMDSASLTMSLEEDCLAKLVNTAVENLRPQCLASNHALRWTYPEGEFLYDFDWDWMYRAVENLLENAIKYTPAGGQIEVEVRLIDSLLQISVSDNGPGIPEELQPRLFQRYTRGSSSTPGTGLGLVIVKRVAEAHGGKVVVHSTPGGSQFSLNLVSK